MGERDAIEPESGPVPDVQDGSNTPGGQPRKQPEAAVETLDRIEALVGAEAAVMEDVAVEDAVADQATADAAVDDTASDDRTPGHVAAGDAAAEDTAAIDDPRGGDTVDSGGASTGEGAADHLVAGSGALHDVAAEDGVGADTASDIAFEPPARVSAELKAIVEALIFASPEPLSLNALTKLLDSEPKEDVATALVGLKDDYERPGGLQLVEVAGGYQIVTRHDLHEWVRRLFHERSTQKLSAQALETLAVVAYRQPITAVEITEIRGVNASGVLNTLLERHLIKIVGRKAVVGRPFMYSTTKEFLIRFGLNDLTDLPRVEDMVDALGLEAPLLVERAPLEDQLPLEEPEEESDEAPPGEPEGPEGRGGPGEPGSSIH